MVRRLRERRELREPRLAHPFQSLFRETEQRIVDARKRVGRTLESGGWGRLHGACGIGTAHTRRRTRARPLVQCHSMAASFELVVEGEGVPPHAVSIGKRRFPSGGSRK
jgi:hypothetical protein